MLGLLLLADPHVVSSHRFLSPFLKISHISTVAIDKTSSFIVSENLQIFPYQRSPALTFLGGPESHDAI